MICIGCFLFALVFYKPKKDSEDFNDPSLYKNLSFQLYNEEIPRITSNYGNQELKFDSTLYKHSQIIQLTHNHYLGIDQEKCFIYKFDDSNLHHPNTVKLLSVFETNEKVTLEKVLSLFQQTNLEEYTEIFKLLYKAPIGDGYISSYRCIKGQIDNDIFTTIGIILVLIDNDFEKTYLGTVAINEIGPVTININGQVVKIDKKHFYF